MTTFKENPNAARVIALSWSHIFLLPKWTVVSYSKSLFFCQIDYNQFKSTTIVLLHISWLDSG